MDTTVIKIMGKLAEFAYRDWNVGQTIPTTPYTVLEVANYSSGMQAYLLQEAGTGKYVFAFRGTEDDSFSEFYKDLVIADISMGLGTVPRQMKDAMEFVHDMMTNAHEGMHYDINNGNTVFTGHSLGGSLASMASYVYGFQAYSYNGFGVQNMLWSADDTSTEDHPKKYMKTLMC